MVTKKKPSNTPKSVSSINGIGCNSIPPFFCLPTILYESNM